MKLAIGTAYSLTRVSKRDTALSSTSLNWDSI